MNISYHGHQQLRNDNPYNIVVPKQDNITKVIRVRQGDFYFLNKEFFKALKCYKEARYIMQNRDYCDSFCADDEKLELLICSDITMSYMNLCLYEDAYSFCDRVLKEQLYYENVTEFFTVDLDRLYVELLYLKAMCLAHLS